MIEFFAEHFASNGTRQEAKKILEQHSTEMRRNDALFIAFFSGCSLILTMLGVFFGALTPLQPGQDFELKYLYHSSALFRFFGLLVYIVFATGFCINVFVSYGINYLYIFECDPNSKMTHHQLYKVGTLLLFLWSATFEISVMQVKLDVFLKDEPLYICVAFAIFFAFYCLQPCIRCGYRVARYELMITIKEIFISPFGRVRFRDFFFADVITSMG